MGMNLIHEIVEPICVVLFWSPDKCLVTKGLCLTQLHVYSKAYVFY
jgi:hypothetical protein